MIRNLLVALAAPVVLSNAPMAVPMGNDGYAFERKDFTRLALRLRVMEYKSRAALHSAYQILNPGSPYPHGLLAFARWDERGCTIHIVDPSVSYEPHVVGHELTHCLHGHFHPNQPKSMS